MAKRREVWQTLNLGDRVRLVEIPAEFLKPGYTIMPETMRVYQKLLARGRPVRVTSIDEWDRPWIECRFRRTDGTYECHWLLFDHDGIVKVK